MIVRLFAALVAALFGLGLLVGSAEANEPSAEPTIVLVDSAGGDAADAADEVDTITFVHDPREPACTLVPITASTAPPHDAPCVAVFRPPRAYAFN